MHSLNHSHQKKKKEHVVDMKGVQKSLAAWRLKSHIKDTQVYFPSLIVPPSSHRRPERAHIWRILLSRAFQACQLLTAAAGKPTTMGEGEKSLCRFYTFTLSCSRSRSESAASPPRWLLAPFIVGLINNLWECRIIVMAFRLHCLWYCSCSGNLPL